MEPGIMIGIGIAGLVGLYVVIKLLSAVINGFAGMGWWTIYFAIAGAAAFFLIGGDQGIGIAIFIYVIYIFAFVSASGKVNEKHKMEKHMTKMGLTKEERVVYKKLDASGALSNLYQTKYDTTNG